MSIEKRNTDAQCPGSFTAALEFDLRTGDRAVCSACGVIVPAWLQDGEWYRNAHQAGVTADEADLANLVGTGVRGAAISLDYGPSR